MDEIERIEPTITRLFGPSARLAGSIGTVQRPGRLEIRVGGVTAGSGPTLGDAIRAASTVLSVAARRTTAA